MKKALVLVATLSLLMTMVVGVAGVQAEDEKEALTTIIQDFETSSVISAGDNQTPVVWNTANPLNGKGSVKITWAAGNRKEEAFDFSGSFQATGYTGIVFRAKTDVEYDAWIRLWLPDLDSEAHGTEFWATLGVNAVFMDMEGNDVTPDYYAEDTYKNLCRDYKGFSIPAGFNGYVFIPFTGKTNDGLDYSLELNAHLIRFMMLTAGSEFTPRDDYWDNKSLELDSIALYKGADMQAIMDELTVAKTGYVTYVHNFNAGREFKNNQVDTMGVTLVHEVANPLLGGGSLKIELAKEDTEPSFGSTLVDVTGNKGFVFRLKTNCADNSWMRFYLQKPGVGNFFLGDGVTLYDMEGNDITPDFHSAADYNGKEWMGFSLPANFDGYVFAPMTGVSFEDSDKTYALNEEYIPMFALLNYSNMGNLTSWVGKEVVIDSIAMYNTDDYQAVMAELALDVAAPNTVEQEQDPKEPDPPAVDPELENGAVKIIFNMDSELPFTNDEPALEISQQTNHALIGSGTLKGAFGAGVSAETGLTSVKFEGTAGYRGIVFRFRSNVGDRAMIRTWMSNEKDVYALGKGVKMINVYGEDVTPEEISDAPGYAGYFTIANFDGYIFLPFPGSDWWDKTGIDPALDTTLLFKFVNRFAAWDGTKFFIDQIAYYKGETLEDYQKAIVNLGGTIEDKNSQDTGDLLTDTENGITLEDMFGGAIPNGAKLNVEKLNVSQALEKAVKFYGEKAVVVGNYNIYLTDEMFYEDVEPSGRAMRLVFNIPEDADPANYAICVVNSDDTIEKLETEYDDGEAYVYAATMQLGKFALVEIEPVVKDDDDTSGNENSGGADENDSEIPNTGVGFESVVFAGCAALLCGGAVCATRKRRNNDEK